MKRLVSCDLASSIPFMFFISTSSRRISYALSSSYSNVIVDVLHLGWRRVKTEDAPCLSHSHSYLMHSKFCCADSFIGIPEAFFCHQRRASFYLDNIEFVEQLLGLILWKTISKNEFSYLWDRHSICIYFISTYVIIKGGNTSVNLLLCPRFFFFPTMNKTFNNNIFRC